MPMIPDWTRAGIRFSFHPSDGSVDARLPDGTYCFIRRDRWGEAWEADGRSFPDDETAEDWLVSTYGEERELR